MYKCIESTLNTHVSEKFRQWLKKEGSEDPTVGHTLRVLWQRVTPVANEYLRGQNILQIAPFVTAVRTTQRTSEPSVTASSAVCPVMRDKTGDVLIVPRISSVTAISLIHVLGKDGDLWCATFALHLRLVLTSWRLTAIIDPLEDLCCYVLI